MGPGEPDYELRRILLDPLYEERVRYFQGSALVDKDLDRVMMSEAKAAFVM